MQTERRFPPETLIMLTLMILAATSVLYAPASKWTVASHEAGCTLSRSFSQNDSVADLSLTLDASGAAKFDIALEPSHAGLKSGPGHVALLPGGPTLDTKYFGSGSFTVAGRLSFVMRLDPTDMAKLSDAAGGPVNAMRIDAMGRNIVLSTGATRAAFAALNTCRALLLKSWGLDPAAVLPPPRVERDWFKGDAPFGPADSALIPNELFAVLSVSSDGRPVKCRFVAASRNPRSDVAACDALVAHARFAPAAGAGERSSVVKLAGL